VIEFEVLISSLATKLLLWLSHKVNYKTFILYTELNAVATTKNILPQIWLAILFPKKNLSLSAVLRWKIVDRSEKITDMVA